MSSTAPAPSDICEELLAVTLPPMRSTGFSQFKEPFEAGVLMVFVDRDNAVVGADRVRGEVRIVAVERDRHDLVGELKLAKIAASAFWCEAASANASWSSRPTFHRFRRPSAW